MSQRSSLHCGDCLEIMRGMDDNSVDLIATDPPYFRVKNEEWDRQWDSRDAFLSWIGELCDEWRRILRPNGSLYVFASPQLRAWVECEISRRFNCMPSITWRKGANGGRHKGASKEALRSFFPETEAIIFAEHYGADNMAKGEAGYATKCDELRGFVFEPLRKYLDDERKRAGVTPKQCNEVCGNQMAGHYFTRTQWTLPTQANYTKLREGFSLLNHNGQYLQREYEDLRREYEDLRRPFSVSPDVPYTDVWDYPTVGTYPDKHPCEKPLEMMEHIIQVSSRPGAVVLDCFMGSGVTIEAAEKHGRMGIGIEKDPTYFRRATARIQEARDAHEQMELVC